jgi:CBS domain-containing protein
VYFLRFAEGRLDRLPALARELVELRVDLIVAVSAAAVQLASHRQACPAGVEFAWSGASTLGSARVTCASEEDRTMKVTSILKAKGGHVATVRPDATIAAVVRELTARSIGAVVVSEDEVNLLGLVSERDIVHALGVYGARTLDLRASDIMTRRPVSCRPDDSVTRLMADMTRHRVRHLPVVEEGRLQGIVSIGDVVKHRLDELETEANILREAFIGRH